MDLVGVLLGDEARGKKQKSGVDTVFVSYLGESESKRIKYSSANTCLQVSELHIPMPSTFFI